MGWVLTMMGFTIMLMVSGGVDDDDDHAVSDQDDGDDVESHQDSQGRGGPVLQGPEEEVPLLQGSMALDPVEEKIISILNLIFSLKVAANFLLKEVFKETRTKCSPPEVQRARIQPGFSESRPLNGRRVQTTNSIVGICGNAGRRAKQICKGHFLSWWQVWADSEVT